MTIYFLRRGASGPIKIGYTDKADPKHRIAQLQTGQEETLYLLGFIDGSMKDEKSLHYEFREYSIRGEWFAPSMDLVLTIEHVIKNRLPWYHCREIHRKFNFRGTANRWAELFSKEEHDETVNPSPISLSKFKDDVRRVDGIIYKIIQKIRGGGKRNHRIDLHFWREELNKLQNDSAYSAVRYIANWEMQAGVSALIR